jgi:hypothetical protein
LANYTPELFGNTKRATFINNLGLYTNWVIIFAQRRVLISGRCFFISTRFYARLDTLAHNG